MRILVFFVAACAFGQIGAPATSGQPAHFNPLPLSGRAGQNGSVVATQSAAPAAANSVNTIVPSVQIQGPYAGSVQDKAPFSGKLSLREAIERGLQYNLGAVGFQQAVRQAHGQATLTRSALLPNINANLSETVEQLNLQASGIRVHIPIPGVSFPSIVGPFNYFDLRATLSQTVVDLTAWNNHRSAEENLRANKLSTADARDLVVLAVGGAYLEVITADARVQSTRAQLETAKTLYQQAEQQRRVGLVAQIDVNRSHVQMLTQQQRLVSFLNDLAKQKINLARIIGLPPNSGYAISDDVPYASAPAITLEDALGLAFRDRSDLKAARAQLSSAERSRAAARAERLPSVSLSANYGVIGLNPAQAHGTFAVAGSLKVPIWQGGRISGDIEQADAAVGQRQAELEDLRSRVESDVRNVYLDLDAAKSQVDLARENLQVSKENLKLTRERYDAGVSDNVDVVQSQDLVASAELDYIDSVFAYNIAKLSLARAVGQAAANLPRFLEVRQQ